MSETSSATGRKRSTSFLYFVATLAFLLSIQNSFAQENGTKNSYNAKMSRYKYKSADFKKRRYPSVGGSLLYINYFGDLSPKTNPFSTEISQMKIGISGFIQYQYTPSISFRTELLYGRIMANDFDSDDLNDKEASRRYIRNLSFRNDIFELSFTGQYHIFRNYLDFRSRKFINFYLIAGIGVFYHNPKAKVPEFKPDNSRFPNSGEWVALRPLGTEGQFSPHYNTKPYSLIQLSFPAGCGISLKLTERLDFKAELSYRYLLTDYLDDVGKKYVDLGALDSDLAKAMSDRSREGLNAITGAYRDMAFVESNTTLDTYVSSYDGNQYNVYRGFGNDGNIRGGSSYDNFIVTSFKISYIFTDEKKSDKD